MTTGRINQVTTLRTTGPAGPRSHPNSGDDAAGNARPTSKMRLACFHTERKRFYLHTRASRPPNTPTPRTGVYSASATHREHCISQLRSRACLSTKPHRRHSRVGR